MDKLKRLDKRVYVIFVIVIILLVLLVSLIIKKTYSMSDTTSLADVNINENITFSDVKISTTDSIFKYSGYLISNKDISDVNYINIIPEDETGNTLATLVDYIGANIVAGVKKEISASTNKVVLTSMHDIRYEIVKNDGSVIKVSETSLASTTTTTTTGTTKEKSACDGKVYDFVYTGDVQTFTTECQGYYKIEAWGARGGNGNGFSTGGLGAYANMVIYLNASSLLNVYVGQHGSDNNMTTASFNGGAAGGGDSYGGAENGGSGGGASDVRLTGTDYASRIIVAGGGGGAGGWYTVDGQPGGLASGSNGVLGIGTIGITTQSGGGGGGGGYYGGATRGSAYINFNVGLGAYGGTSFVSSSAETSTLIDGASKMSNFAGTGTMTGNSDNGYVLISFVGKSID